MSDTLLQFTRALILRLKRDLAGQELLNDVAESVALGCVPQVLDLEAANAELLAMLERLEWCTRENYLTKHHCPVCENYRPDHTDNCELAALIKKARGE